MSKVTEDFKRAVYPLVEMSFRGVPRDKVITKELKDGFLSSDFESIWIEFEVEYEDQYDEDEWEEIEKDPERFDVFNEWYQNYLEMRYENAEWELGEQVRKAREGNRVVLYRVMRVGDDWLKHLEKQGKHLGIYWSFREDSAEAHWGDFSKPVSALVVTSIKEDQIDWITTFQVNMSPSTGEDEDEIRLFKGTPLKIEAVYFDGEEQDISKLKGKVFKA